jgi:hypothetical protein
MPKISFDVQGSFKRTEDFFLKVKHRDIYKALDTFAKQGVAALASATPVDTGETATLWDYEIHSSRGSYSITWTNSNVVNGTPVAIMLQYGHGTGTGGYVVGRDYINPALEPIFDKIADNVWKAVTTA